MRELRRDNFHAEVSNLPLERQKSISEGNASRHADQYRVQSVARERVL
jgi:hypothetical protein